MNLKRFFADDSGAITVDWVVLTASVMMLGLAAVLAMGGGAISLGGDISAELQDDKVFVSGKPSSFVPANAVSDGEDTSQDVAASEEPAASETYTDAFSCVQQPGNSWINGSCHTES